MKALTKTDFNFPGQKSVYHGKVRDVYNINGEKLVMVATDRISAFDVVLPKGIPFKGQMLNQIAAKFLDATTDICPNWKTATPDPMVTVGVMCEGFPIEMIVRGYLCGSAWRTYKSGVREICGVKLPEGMKENQKFPEPIITPTTKAEIGEHDADISKEEILSMYVSHAPFGGNVVGLDAASWRYFGHSAEDLSWAESAMLAVLPNAPAIIHLSKGRKTLLAKRNRLLKQLLDKEIIDSSTYELAVVLSDIEKLTKEKEKATKKLAYLEKKLSGEK